MSKLPSLCLVLDQVYGGEEQFWCFSFIQDGFHMLFQTLPSLEVPLTPLPVLWQSSVVFREPDVLQGLATEQDPGSSNPTHCP